MDEANKPDNIEKLIKEAAENAQFDFNTEAWQAMEAKLDGKSWRVGAWWKFGLPVLLIAILAFFFWPQAGSEGDALKVIEPVESQDAIPDQVLDAKVSEQEQKDILEQNESDATEALLDTQEKSSNNRISTSQVTRTRTTSKLKAGENSKVEYFSKDTQPISGLGSIDNENSKSYGLINELSGLERQSALLPFSEIQPWILDSTFTKYGKLDSAFRRFTYGLVLSLDLSSTRLEGFTDPGTMVGLIGEYRVNKNWALQSGVAYATKIYSAFGSEYETPEWALNAPNEFASVLAKCLVIDIPINMKRYFTTKKGNQWFLSGGISSYFMLREDYTYEYSANRPAWPDTWRYENKNNHFFGIANISGGVVRPLTKKLNINIEPFMKLPLTGIGEGKVKFLSFGTNVSITFK